MDHHLELGQLCRCPVEWCTLWKGSVQDCLYHLRSKHDGTRFLDLNTLEKFFPQWTVSREFWRAVPGIRLPVSSPVQDLQRSYATCVRLGWGDPETPRVCSPDDGNRSVDSFAFDSSVIRDDL